MKKSKSSLFLMELIIVILFFALTSAVCLQVFVKAHSIDRETKNINNAVMWGDNMSEVFYEIGPDALRIIELTVPGYEPISDSSNGYKLYLDKDYKFTADIESAFFMITLSLYSDEHFNYMTYIFSDLNTGETAYAFTYKSNIQEVLK